MGRRQGSLSRVTTVDGRARIWQSMRILRRFTVPDLVATAEVGLANVHAYVKALLQARFLRLIKPKREGVKDGHPIYMLIRNTGPNQPRVRQHGKSVWDPNTDEEVPRG